MEAGPRHVPIRSGSVAWLFPALTGVDDVAAVTAALADADDQLARIAESLPLVHVARSEPSARGLVYYRLGPAPYPTTELIFEPWSEEIGILLRLWVPATPMWIIERVGPPWKAGAWVEGGIVHASAFASAQPGLDDLGQRSVAPLAPPHGEPLRFLGATSRSRASATRRSTLTPVAPART